MPWYKTGTVSVVLNSNAVTGTGTAFIVNSRVGDAFRGPDGRWYEVTNVASNTAISIDPPYIGATASGGSYALAPMQGYVKDSADALRAIVNTYGAQLAALKTTGNYDVLPVSKGGTGGTTQAEARAGLGLGAVSTDNVVPVARGGTGGTTLATARTGLGLKSASVADIVGTVSQSGGVPTGAIIERGSNVNGEYVRYADGTLHCWLAAVTALSHTANVDLITTWTLPYPCAALNTGVPSVSVRSPSSTNVYNTNKLQSGMASVADAQFRTNFSVTQNYILYFNFVGRWY
ncbi:phage tail protein [Pseudomonas sp. NFACC05-1]|uniref:phage tail protein n=1 Tax=Pseudomonas sp. NFACC05-1 TaxID=1566241 RepID=UPI0008715384|nr:phage tail protein [Pseudomonas sp. NFACC05-1]SCW88674.1 hypothetical protein SAMN03159424_03948 [Pseudomonas sp. NFACC05-1]